MTPLPRLLAASARVLDTAADLPPVDVGLEPGAAVLAPITLTPAAVLPTQDQYALVHTVAAAHGWSAEQLADIDGW